MYERPIYPLGQVYLNPRNAEVRRFRRLAQAYGAPGVSWWVWQHAGGRQWTALGSAFEPIGFPRIATGYPVLKRGYRSDQVIWAQQHLKTLGLISKVTGRFGSGTVNAVRAAAAAERAARDRPDRRRGVAAVARGRARAGALALT